MVVAHFFVGRGGGGGGAAHRRADTAWPSTMSTLPYNACHMHSAKCTLFMGRPYEAARRATVVLSEVT